MTFFGTEEACKLAQELFDFWYLEIDRMARVATAEYIKECEEDPWFQAIMAFHGVKQIRHLPDLGAMHPNVWRDSWCYGVVNGVHRAIDAEQEERTPETSTALMVVNSKVTKAYKEHSKGFSKSAKSSSGLNADAYHSGTTVGKGLNLKTAVAKKIK